MDRLHRAIKNVHRLDDLAARGTALTRLPPLPKLLAVLVYLCVTLSFQKYALTGLLGMALWPILLYEIDDLSIVKTLRQCWAVVALLVLVGIANLFFDCAPVLTLGPVVLSGGAVTLLVLVVKGVLCFLAVYLLIATTGMERVCAAPAACPPGAGDDNFVDLSLYRAASAGGEPNLDGLRPACTGGEGHPFPRLGFTAGAAAIAECGSGAAGV